MALSDLPPAVAVVIALEASEDAQAVERLVSQAFGAGRFAKTAERLRERSQPIPGLCFVAREAGATVGTVRLWPVEACGVKLAFLGPIAVESGHRRGGLGAELVQRALNDAKAQGWPAVLLVGDEPYFGRFGFRRVMLNLPGPVDPRRVLACELEPGALDALKGGDVTATR